jgi:hypothetical protein
MNSFERMQALFAGVASVPSVAVFTWKGPLPSDDEVGADPATRYSGDYGEQWAYQACQPVGVAILEAVRRLGYKTDVERPYFGEHGWHFAVQVGPQSYSVMVQWVARGSRHDEFAVQASVVRGCLAGLLLPRPAETALRPVCAILQQALRSEPQVADIEWVNDIG